MKTVKVLLSSLVLALFCSACTDSPDPEPETTACGVLGLEERSANGRIINGTECGRTNSPVVQLTILPENGGVAICSGTMITQQHVLTAAHCFIDDQRDENNNPITNFLSASVQVQGRDIPVAQVAIHPDVDINPLPPQNDVAIAILASPVSVPTLPLVASRGIQPGDIFSIFGFGLDEDNVTGILRSGQMRILSINSQFFSAAFDRSASNICSGDSGGPAVSQFTNSQGNLVTGIIGINSFVTIPCEVDGTGSFENVQGNSIFNFITSVVPNVGVI